MTIQKATLVLHPNTIGTQVKDPSNGQIIIEFTESNDYNGNRHAAEKWLTENGYIHVGASDYEKSA